MALTLAPDEGIVDVPKLLTNLRKQRMKMVQTVVSIDSGECYTELSAS
jgi:protein tyrosine phosphatase